MTPKEADERIILSRQTLHRYRAMMDSGVIPHADVGLMEAEIGILADIAEQHPAKAAKVTALAGQWRLMMHDIAPRH